MKFKITREHLFWWPVVVKMPDPDARKAGQMLKQEFKMQFLAMTQDEAKAAYAEIEAMEPNERQNHEHDLMLRVCQNWDDQVVDDENQPVPFSQEQLRDLMQNNFFRIGLYSAFQQAMSGEGARLKN